MPCSVRSGYGVGRRLFTRFVIVHIMRKPPIDTAAQSGAASFQRFTALFGRIPARKPVFACPLVGRPGEYNTFGEHPGRFRWPLSTARHQRGSLANGGTT